MMLQVGEKLQQLQDTVPLDDHDDTVALDSPLAETQMEKLGFDTEEVILDSEDDEEGICPHQSENNHNGLSTRNALDVDTGLLNVENADERNDHVHLRECDQGLVRLNYVGSEEPGESSQATALGFVDQFLSLSGVNLSPRTEPRNTVRKILSPVLSAKGSQHLAKLAKTRTPVGKNGTFEWVDDDWYEGFNKRMDGCFDFAGCHQSSVAKHQPAGYVDSKEGCSLNNECEEKSAKEICRVEVEQVSEMPLENQLEIHGTETHTADLFDVGFNTQIAAEAMEALFYGPPADSSACNAYQDPHGSLVDSSKVVKNSKVHLNEFSHEKGALCNLEGITRVPKQRKSCSRKLSSGSSQKQLSHPELPETAKRKWSEPLVRELTGRSVICANECSASTPSRAACKFKTTCDGSDDVMEENIIKYTRKRSRLAPKPTEVLNAVNASEEAKKRELSQQKVDSLEVYGPKSSLNAWSYPKRKRTYRKLPSHSNANKKCTMFNTFDSRESKRRPVNKNLPRSSFLKEHVRLGAHESKPDFGWRDLRKRREMAYVRVLFSQHLENDIIKQQKKILVRLGITTASCLMEATHFIANRFVRTRNMLEAIALGKPVVTHFWLESCGQASCLIDEKNYILRDEKKEKEIGFSLPVSLACANQHPLLEGRRVFITANVKPNKETITSLVNAAHGQAVEKRQISSLDDLLILSCEEDHEICASLLDKGAAIYSSELLLNGIVIQKLEYERHRLFVNPVKGNRPWKR